MSLAMAHMMKKKKKCMAEGGMPEDEMHEVSSDTMSPIAKGMKKAFKAPGYADGGDVKGVHKDYSASVGGHHGQSKAGDHTRWAYAHSYQGDDSLKESYKEKAKDEHKKVLGEMKSMKGHDRKYLAEGGEVEEEMASGYEPMPCEKCGHMAGHAVENQDEGMEDDMIAHIMKKRAGHYSEGGKVSNEDEPMADSEPAEFDDLVKDDNLEEHYTGKNSGDEDGNKEEDEDRHDIVSQIMKSRKKKDKMPRPA